MRAALQKAMLLSKTCGVMHHVTADLVFVSSIAMGISVELDAKLEDRVMRESRAKILAQENPFPKSHLSFL